MQLRESDNSFFLTVFTFCVGKAILKNLDYGRALVLGVCSSSEQSLLVLPALPALIPQHPLLLALGYCTAHLLQEAAARRALESWGKLVSGKENELLNKGQKYS